MIDRAQLAEVLHRHTCGGLEYGRCANAADAVLAYVGPETQEEIVADQVEIAALREQVRDLQAEVDRLQHERLLRTTPESA